MGCQLIVILGAGASFDCVSNKVARDVDLRPPLVTQLFDERFAPVLAQYPLAQQVAPDIRAAIESGSIALERFLKDELRDSEFAHLRRRYHAIPLYLQHLLLDVGAGFASHPDIYDRLLTECLRLDHVTFLTLNYDTILDDRLSIDARINEMTDYVRAGRAWSLVKLHGSVNWARRVLNGPRVAPSPIGVPASKSKTFAAEFAELGEDIALDGPIELRAGAIEALRTDANYVAAGDLYYPALAAPLGSEDEIVCPEWHVEHVRTVQRESPQGLNLLVIGYSGLDQQLLDLLAWGVDRLEQ